MLLAIDTSAGTSVALVHDGRVLAERASTDARSHAELIGPFLQEVLAAAGEPDSAGAGALDAVAVGMGPGPFTGLRVGIAAARAFAFGRGLPIIPVVSHDAVAFAAGAPCTVQTDARRRELARSVYAEPGPGGVPVRVSGPELVPREGEDAAVAAPSAAALGLLAELLFARDPAAATRPIQPVYLRPPDVTLSAGPKRVTQ